MGKKGSGSGYGAQKQKNQDGGGGKPRLTHFLCLPLVNQTSIPQLIASLEEFKASIPLVSSSAASRAVAAGHAPAQTPLVPDGALRPLGTLHLTLGVMSLPTQDQVDEALNFLQSLDVVSIMQEAEAETRVALPAGKGKEPAAADQAIDDALSPLTVNLTSLQAMPSKRSATILHASPVDPTSRLYPFCVRLRNKFIEAGFIHQEMIKGSGGKKSGDAPPETPAVGDGQHGSGSEGDLPNIRSAKTSSQATASRRPRPLLLHATISNTIYLGRRWNQGEKGGGGGKKKKEVYKFDATELLSRFGDPSPPAASQQKSSGLSRKAIPRNQPFEIENEETVRGEEERPQPTPRSQTPFVWAEGIPLNRLCICEMGAKPVPHDDSQGGPELGEEYTVVGERSLDFSPVSA